MLYLSCEKNKNKQKEAGFGPFLNKKKERERMSWQRRLGDIVIESKHTNGEIKVDPQRRKEEEREKEEKWSQRITREREREREKQTKSNNNRNKSFIVDVVVGVCVCVGAAAASIPKRSSSLEIFEISFGLSLQHRASSYLRPRPRFKKFNRNDENFCTRTVLNISGPHLQRPGSSRSR